MSFREKYLKYKKKYIELKKQFGGCRNCSDLTCISGEICKDVAPGKRPYNPVDDDLFRYDDMNDSNSNAEMDCPNECHILDPISGKMILLRLKRDDLRAHLTDFNCPNSEVKCSVPGCTWDGFFKEFNYHCQKFHGVDEPKPSPIRVYGDEAWKIVSRYRSQRDAANQADYAAANTYPANRSLRVFNWETGQYIVNPSMAESDKFDPNSPSYNNPNEYRPSAASIAAATDAVAASAAAATAASAIDEIFPSGQIVKSEQLQDLAQLVMIENKDVYVKKFNPLFTLEDVKYIYYGEVFKIVSIEDNNLVIGMVDLLGRLLVGV